MPMRQDCKNYESRTYPSGDTVRMCRLDLAPEAPWRCPENCPAYERKIAGGGWTTGGLGSEPAPDEPPNLDEHAISLLDQAEDIINAVGPDYVAEIAAQRAAQAAKPKRKWWPFGRK